MTGQIIDAVHVHAALSGPANLDGGGRPLVCWLFPAARANLGWIEQETAARQSRPGAVSGMKTRARTVALQRWSISQDQKRPSALTEWWRPESRPPARCYYTRRLNRRGRPESTGCVFIQTPRCICCCTLLLHRQRRGNRPPDPHGLVGGPAVRRR